MTDNNIVQHSIIQAVKMNQLSVVETALKNGADANTIDPNHKNLLLLATEVENPEMAELLISYGADVNQQDKQLDSPFLLAGALGHAALVTLFLKHGARFDIFNRYNGTALIPACERGHLAVVRILANTPGFPIDHINRLGWTALMEAVVLGDGSSIYVTIIQTLVDAGCSITIPDKDGVTALQHATRSGYSEIVTILKNVSDNNSLV